MRTGSLSQTFLPHPSFEDSARVLDKRRLGDQRVHVLQIVNALDRSQDKGWKSLPATQMWTGYPGALVNYGFAVCDEWVGRGYRDTVRGKLWALFFTGTFVHTVGDNGRTTDHWDDLTTAIMPPWLGREDIHASHRAVLLDKDPEWYGQFGWIEEPRSKVIWP